MAETVDIFIQTDLAYEDLVRAIERQLGITFIYVPDAHGPYYAYLNDQVQVLVLDGMGFDNDRDMHFADYQYFVSVGFVRRRGDIEQFLRERDQFARFVFEKLKATGRFGLLMTLEMQLKLDEFHPRHPNVADITPIEVRSPA